MAEAQKPIADESREQQALRMFRIHMSPEEYLARYSHQMGCSSFDQYTYRDKKLQEWIYKMHYLLKHERGRVDEWRKQFLSPGEIREVREKEGDF